MKHERAASETYRFANGIVLRRADLIDRQVARYTSPGHPNLHEPEEERWLLRVFPAAVPDRPVFIDVGAGVGYYSILIKTRFPDARVLALEPLTNHAEAIPANAALNGLVADAIRVGTYALGSRDGQAEFLENSFASGFRRGQDPKRKADRMVKTRTLATLLDRFRRIHLMKIDIQGAEAEVIEASASALETGRGYSPSGRDARR